ncbi:MAG: SMI1/KNR4 family protein [Planctomycetes bacterium]|nr:SMI1/KNR4 family protein [Planctomycetota bacterium]
MPPPKSLQHTGVNWSLLEEHIGLRYPESFKEFVAVYGSCHWFDKLLPFYGHPKSPREAKAFVKDVAKKLKWLRGNTYDERFNKLDLPLYPAPGGLFPFMADIDGPEYFWQTEDRNPDRWPVYCWMRGPITVLEGVSIADMLLGFLERDPVIVRLWGDVRNFSSDRIRIEDVCSE